MNKTSLTALQFFSNFYQKVDHIFDILCELSDDQRFPETLCNDFASAANSVHACYDVIKEAIDFVSNNDLPEHGNQNTNKANG